MDLKDKELDVLVKDYTDRLSQYEELLNVGKEVFKSIEAIRRDTIELEIELVRRGVEITDVGT